MPTYDRPSATGRLALSLVGFVMLGLLGWDVSDGVIHLGGRAVNRQSDPTLFWLEAVGIAVVVLGVFYLAVFGLPRRESGAARS
jgi:hypothetical protein